MKLQIPTTVEFSPVRLIVSALVRYWEDTYVNGQEDTEGTLIPLREGDRWNITIELESGRVLNWPQGTDAETHYKVCDAGEYWLEDAEGKRAEWAGHYVPDDLLSGGNGYGDYIILRISKDGIIEDWKPIFDPSDWTL